MIYATLSTHEVQATLRNATASKALCSNYDVLIEQYAQALKIGLQSFSSCVAYILRGAK